MLIDSHNYRHFATKVQKGVRVIASPACWEQQLSAACRARALCDGIRLASQACERAAGSQISGTQGDCRLQFPAGFAGPFDAFEKQAVDQVCAVPLRPASFYLLESLLRRHGSSRQSQDDGPLQQEVGIVRVGVDGLTEYL